MNSTWWSTMFLSGKITISDACPMSIEITSKKGLNQFFDAFDREIYKYVIVVLTSNRPRAYFQERRCVLLTAAICSGSFQPFLIIGSQKPVGNLYFSEDSAISAFSALFVLICPERTCFNFAKQLSIVLISTPSISR
jgi:hypothetical protein